MQIRVHFTIKTDKNTNINKRSQTQKLISDKRLQKLLQKKLKTYQI